MTEQVERQHEDVVAETILLEDALEEVYLELTSDELRRFQQWVLHKKSEIAKWTVTEKISVLWVLQNKLKRRGLVSLREHSTIEILRYIFRNPYRLRKKVERREREKSGPTFIGVNVRNVDRVEETF